MHSVGFAFDLQVKLILLGVKRFLLPAVVTLATLLSFMWPMSLSAHAVMVKSSPEKDSTISQPPKKIDIWFNEKVRGAHKSLAVTDSTGKRVDNKDVKQELLDQSHILAGERARGKTAAPKSRKPRFPGDFAVFLGATYWDRTGDTWNHNRV